MYRQFYLFLCAALFAVSCSNSKSAESPKSKDEQNRQAELDKGSESFQWKAEEVADLGIYRYQIPEASWKNLDLTKQTYVYYLTQAGLAGRDIMWDQNYRHNLEIREALEKAIFDKDFDKKKVELNPEKGLLESSAVNFYAPDISTAEAEAFYEKMIDKTIKRPVEYGLNSRLYKDENGTIKEDVYKVDGLYGPAIEKVVFWLKKAEPIAETERKAAALRKLIRYYETGDLKVWDDYNVQWAAAVEGDVDYINGFIEVYNDPLGFRGSYETIVEINDVDASQRMKVLMDNVQWFEDNSPFLPEHKKDSVVGVSYKVVNVAGEAGDASPSTPIGVNLPNSNWIRAQFGSKSVSLGNIVEAFDKAGGSGMLKEFVHDDKELKMAEKYGDVAGKLHTALHEVVGHASGDIEDGVGTPKETLKSYASTIEEGRADLVARPRQSS